MRKRPEGIAREMQCSVKQLTFTKQEEKRAFIKPFCESAI